MKLTNTLIIKLKIKILVRMKNISDWVNVVREEYFKTHDEVFPDDEPLWDESILTDVER